MVFLRFIIWVCAIHRLTTAAVSSLFLPFYSLALPFLLKGLFGEADLNNQFREVVNGSQTSQQRKAAHGETRPQDRVPGPIYVPVELEAEIKYLSAKHGLESQHTLPRRLL